MLRRVVLLAALAVLVLPASAFADTIDFSFQGGNVSLSGSAITGSSTLVGVCDPTGSGCPNILGNLGTVSFTTGNYLSTNGTSLFFGPGGTLSIASNASFPTLGAATLFSGSFTGTTTLSPSGSNWNLTGTISGDVLAGLYTLLGLPVANPANGSLITLIVSFDANGRGTISSGDINVSSVPEPGTLALFGTGLLGLAGLVRRRLNI